jgi:hypothetical protein
VGLLAGCATIHDALASAALERPFAVIAALVASILHFRNFFLAKTNQAKTANMMGEALFGVVLLVGLTGVYSTQAGGLDTTDLDQKAEAKKEAMYANMTK